MEQSTKPHQAERGQVKGIDKYRVRKTGFEYFIDLHVLVEGHIPVRQGHDIAHRVKAVILEEKPAVYDVLIHIEPV
ncbi:cation transporter dimerization domain-containing protein [Larkinella sp.]|uniref:cation transporter dimerization domain-containing protein n=1 Tax=Larkinella sp. TaxID=2034517 RepID=UPI003BABC652